jgi:hypothetical protein
MTNATRRVGSCRLPVKLYPDDDHWVMLEKGKSLAQDMRRFIDNDKTFPKESVYRANVR